jgi:hypothetical protein
VLGLDLSEQSQQTAYAHLYITEHGSSVSGGLGPAASSR